MPTNSQAGNTKSDKKKTKAPLFSSLSLLVILLLIAVIALLSYRHRRMARIIQYRLQQFEEAIDDVGDEMMFQSPRATTMMKPRRTPPSRAFASPLPPQIPQQEDSGVLPGTRHLSEII